ncbi:MAG: ABC transporter permease [Actinomycetota bacterium]
MLNVFRGTWTSLRRPGLLFGTYGAVAVVAALITSLTFVSADGGGPRGRGEGGPPGGPGTGSTVESLSEATGLLQGYQSSVQVLGVVALCVAAAVFAGLYSQGTLRNLLIRQPSRWRLLTGTWAAIVTFMGGAVLTAAVVAAGFAIMLAGGQGIETDAWFSSEGAAAAWQALWQVAVAIAGYSTLGSALGVLMRASIPAVALGFGWLFALETIITGTVDGSDRWLPGQVLSAVASNGTAEVTFAAALVTAISYLVVSATAAGTSFIRRDVTA